MPLRLSELESASANPGATRWRERLRAGESLHGMWLASGDAYVAEICGDAGLDWLLIDCEHSPNDTRTVLAQLQALQASRSFPVVRVPSHDRVAIGQALDLGARGVMVPMVDSADEARAVVAATRYPPHGDRGVGTGFARGARWNQISDYLAEHRAATFLLVQIESRRALEALPEICAVDGVDGVFLGPADLAASLGHPGEQGHPEVRAAVETAIRTAVQLGSYAGVNAFDHDTARAYERAGAQLLQVGADVTLLSAGSRALVERYRKPEESGKP
ncbi:MAG: hpaI [Frankiales bacterium]|nr:hpaI [Frankiales bacterium]